MSWARWAGEQRAAIDAAGRRRTIVDLDGGGVEVTLDDGRRAVTFASNDYLGLSQHPDVIRAAHNALDRWGTGSGAARLIVGSRPIHSALERAIAQWKSAEAAVLFPNGYAANLGVLTVFGGAGVALMSDELNHASIVDGCRLARGTVNVYAHRDVDALGRLLARADRAVVVTDTVFSMDGDVAPVMDIAERCRRHGALLIVDEAHAVLGPHIESSSCEMLRVGTLSKFLGSMGGYVAGPRDLIDLLIDRARPFIFTTASSPADAAAAMAAVAVVRSGEGAELRARLRRNIDRVAPGHPSPIIPVVLGDEHVALDAAQRMLDRGIVAPAIRPPSVPEGTSRLRVTISAAHTDEHIDALVSALSEMSAVVAHA